MESYYKGQLGEFLSFKKYKYRLKFRDGVEIHQILPPLAKRNPFNTTNIEYLP